MDFLKIEEEIVEKFALKIKKLPFKTQYYFKSKLVFVHNLRNNRLCIKLAENEQDIFSNINIELIHPVPNRWGKYGWTLFYYQNLSEELITDAVSCGLAFVKSGK